MRHALRLIAGLTAGLCAASCLTNPLDPDVSGVFPCETHEECPPSQSCLFGACEAVDLPQVVIQSPEEVDSAVPSDQYPVYDPEALEFAVPLTVTLQNLRLVDPATDPDAELGQGQLVVELDGEEIDVLTVGEPGANVQTVFVVANEPGVHRLEVFARRSDGFNYDNPESRDRHILWVDDGEVHAAIKSPWPGDAFTNQAVRIGVEVVALGIDIEPPTGQNIPGTGHLHIHYDQPFPDCPGLITCDTNYIGVVPDVSSPVGPANLPPTVTGAATLTGIVREANHTLFRDAAGEVVVDQIQIVRSEDVPHPDEL